MLSKRTYQVSYSAVSCVADRDGSGNITDRVIEAEIDISGMIQHLGLIRPLPFPTH